jgi:hypothetical protein
MEEAGRLHDAVWGFAALGQIAVDRVGDVDVANGRFDRVAYIVLAAKELDVSSHAERFEDGMGLAVRRESLAAG